MFICVSSIYEEYYLNIWEVKTSIYEVDSRNLYSPLCWGLVWLLSWKRRTKKLFVGRLIATHWPTEKYPFNSFCKTDITLSIFIYLYHSKIINLFKINCLNLTPLMVFIKLIVTTHIYFYLNHLKEIKFFSQEPLL